MKAKATGAKRRYTILVAITGDSWNHIERALEDVYGYVQEKRERVGALYFRKQGHDLILEVEYDPNSTRDEFFRKMKEEICDKD